MSSSVDKIKERLGIVDVVSSYVKLERAGNSFKAKCPFHNEKTPSFFVSPERDSYYCFGCGAKGDIFTFVEEMEGLDFKGALKTLADKAGVELVPENPKVRDERDKIFGITEEAAIFFEKNILIEQEAFDYLRKRGLAEKTIKDWRIGYAPSSWRGLETHLKSKGFSAAQMERAGLIKIDGEKSYDRFRGRIIFPIFDASGRVIAFSGRILRDDGKSPKYLNSPETELFNKSKTLYGFDKAKFAIKKMDYGILVEGQMDLIMCHQAGYANAVAVSGTALTEWHLEIIKRFSNRVIMAFDPDNAGFAASARAWRMALSLGMEVKIAELPKGLDPAELILKDKDRWAAALKESKHIIDFYLSHLQREEPDERKLAVKIKDKLLPFLSAMNSNMEKSHFVLKISEATGIKEEAIWDDLKKIKAEEGRQGFANGNEKIEKEKFIRKDYLLRKIIGALFWQESKEKPLISISAANEELKKIVGEKKIQESIDLSKINKEELIFEAEAFYEGKLSLEKEFGELMRSLEEECVKEKLALAMKELSKIEKEGGGEGELKNILMECQILARKLEDLKKMGK